MAKLILSPPISEAHGIVADMLPSLAPGAGAHDVEQCVTMVQNLFRLCTQAKNNPVAEKIFAEFFTLKSFVEVDSAALAPLPASEFQRDALDWKRLISDDDWHAAIHLSHAIIAGHSRTGIVTAEQQFICWELQIEAGRRGYNLRPAASREAETRVKSKAPWYHRLLGFGLHQQ
jgi:hypothetical protein